ncbi:MAG TPA: di-heme-cytochrome C peroxidase [Allosphingosinicella sp.]|nr:di-heme-cytochrome C peroxidase [Allosphingosinicella sp.]
MGRGKSDRSRLFRILALGARPNAASLGIRAAGLLAAAAIVSGGAGQGSAQPPAAASGANIVWLEQNWGADQRLRYHHQSQGTLTLPVSSSWLLALEQPGGSGGMFVDQAYLETFGFIPSREDAVANRDGLPVGFARSTGFNPRDGKAFDNIGFTCAACHTGRIDFNGTSMLVDGGPAMIDLAGFGGELARALFETAAGGERFTRFADRILGPDLRPLDRLRGRARLRLELAGAIAGQAIQELRSRRPGSVTEGFGRLDALNRIGNKVFGDGLGLRANYRATTAPVAFPHIWDTHWLDWVQYNSSIEQPMVRNAGEAMGVGAVVNFNARPTPRYTSTIPIGRLYDSIEEELRGPRQPLAGREFTGLRSPRWPEQVLGPIDRQLAAQGSALYRERCSGCHLPAPVEGEDGEPFWTGNHWSAPNAAGERYLVLRTIPVATIGTDEAQAADMAARTILAPASLGLVRPLGRRGSLIEYGFGDALGQVVELSVDAWYGSQTPPVPAADRDRMNGHRPNGIRDRVGGQLVYKARPLNGIWATAPFLHNGSIRTLYELLSPYAERAPQFRLGSREFDARDVGYVNAGGFLLQTVDARGNPIRGNANTGHLFDVATPQNRGRGIIFTRAFTPEERRAIIEFLKTI